MIVRTSFQILEFQRGPAGLAAAGILRFASADEALRWLKRQDFLHSSLIVRLRDYVAHYCEDPETFRLTNHKALERLAHLLYVYRIVVTVRDLPHSAGEPEAKPAPPAPLFPLSEHAPFAATVDYQPAPADPSTFEQHHDPATQANALMSAAEDGDPLCLECLKARIAAAGSARS